MEASPLRAAGRGKTHDCVRPMNRLIKAQLDQADHVMLLVLGVVLSLVQRLISSVSSSEQVPRFVVRCAARADLVRREGPLVGCGGDCAVLELELDDEPATSPGPAAFDCAPRARGKHERAK